MGDGKPGGCRKQGKGNHLGIINKAPLLGPLPPDGDEKVARQLVGLLVAATRDPAPVSKVYPTIVSHRETNHHDIMRRMRR
jgi:hypothetical protein